jgi:iron complex outermembrane receptor protein
MDATGLAPCLPGTSVVEQPSANALFGADFTNYALFADGTFNVSDRLRFIAGVRWTKDKLSFNHTYNFSPIAGPGIRNQAGGGQAFLSGSNSSDNVSGRAGVQFDFTDDLMSYLSYSRGYKGPAFNVFFNMTANNAQVLDAETADALELGLKSSWLDGRMLFNAAAFWAKYDDFQANNFLFLNGTLITTLTNAGKVTTGGVELELQARPVDRMSLIAGFTYNEARVDEFFTPPGSNPTVRNGTELPLAPKFKGSAAIEYEFPVGRYTLVPNLTISYQDDSFADLNEPAALRIPSYTIVDLSIALRDPDDRFRIALIGRNLGDESYTVLRTGGGPGGAPRLQIPRDADRYFGIQARFNFGAK